MPVAMISTSTSPSFGPSRSTSTISKGCLASNATAARVFIVPPLSSPAFAGEVASRSDDGGAPPPATLVPLPSKSRGGNSRAPLCLQEPSYPTRHARIVVRRIERSDRGVRIGHDVIALLDQRLGEGGRKFGVELEGDRRTVGPGETRIWCELGLERDLGVWRLHDDLVLMRSWRRNLSAAAIHPWFALCDCVAMESGAPSLV